MGATSHNEIELQIRTRGAPDAVRAFEEVRAGAQELRAVGDAGDALGGFDPSALEAATRQVSGLVGELQDLRGVAVAAGGSLTSAVASVPTAQLAQLERQAAEAGETVRELGREAAGTAAREIGELSTAAHEGAAAVQEIPEATGRLRDASGRFVSLGAAAEGAGDGMRSAARQARAAGEDVEDLGDRLGRVADRMERVGNDLSTKVSLPIAAVGTAATKMAVDYDTAMTQMETLAGVPVELVQQWRSELLGMAPDLAAVPGDLAAGLLVVTSAGERGAEALDVLDAAAKASAIGLGDTGTVARTSTAAVQAYGKENLNAARATEIMLATAVEGNFEVSQLAGSMGQVLPVAASMGVSFEEVGAFVAAFTRVNGDASISVTALRSYLQTLLNPTKEVETVLGKVNLSTAKLREQIRERGLTQSLLDLINTLDGNTAALARVIPNVEGLVGVLGTAGLQGEQFAQIAQNVANSTGILDAAFARVSQTDGFKIKQSLAELAVLGVQLGAEVAPALVTLLDAARPVIVLVGDMVEAFGELPEPLQATVMGITGLVVITGPMIAGLGGVISMVVELRAAVLLLNAGNALGGTAALATRAAGAIGGVGTAASGAAAAVGRGAGFAGAAAGLGGIVATGGVLLVGLAAMSALFAEMADNATEAAEEVVDAVERIKASVPKMGAATVVVSAEKADQQMRLKYAEFEEKRRSAQRLFDQGAGNEGAPGHSLYMQLRTEAEGLRTEYRAWKDLAQRLQEERANRNTLPGITVAVAGPKRPTIDLEDDSTGRRRRDAPVQTLGFRDGFARLETVLDGELVRELAAMRNQSSEQLRKLTADLALAEEALRGLPRGTDRWRDANERVFQLRGEVRDLTADVATLSGNLSTLRRRELGPFLVPDEFTVPARIIQQNQGIAKLDPTGLPRDRQQALDQQHGLRQHAGLVAHRIDPKELRGSDRDAVEAILQASGNTWETLARDVGRGSRDLEQAGVVAVNAFGSMVQAAISGTAQMEQVVITGFANMAQAALAQSNPLLGAGIGVLGGIIGSLFARRERRETQPVRVEEYSQRALDQTKRKDGPDVVKLQFVTETGEVLAETGYALERLSRRDAVVRIPQGYRLVRTTP